jgi:hypothetical protein
MKLTALRALAVAGAMGAALAGIAVHGNSASAASVTVPLTPAPGAASYGAGSAFYDSTGASLLVHVDVAGARPATSYRVSACAAFGGPFSCVSDSYGDVVTSDAVGTIHATVATPVPARMDVVTLTNAVDAGDTYRAWFNGAATVYNVPVTPIVYPSVYAPGVTTVNGVVVVPAGTTYVAGTACPRGYVGPLSVVTSTIGPYYGFYANYGYFLQVFRPYVTVPGAFQTVTVYCNGF